MKPLYVIVHEDSIRNPVYSGIIKVDEVLAELERIRRNEDFREVPKGVDSFEIPYELPHVERPILVCGAYGGLCVWTQMDVLRMGGWDASIYKPGTLTLDDVEIAFLD